jgi:hypothetical protein
MKKYIAAGAVAIMVFAFSAFAASLTVNAGPLQAGITADLKCADSVDVTYETNNDHSGFYVEGVNLQFLDANGDATNACDDDNAAISLMKSAPGASPTQQIAFGITNGDITGGYAFIDFKNGAVRADEVNHVQVLMGEQGTPGYVHPAP